MANVLITIGANIGSALTQLRQLGQGLTNLANQAKAAGAAVGGSRGLNSAFNVTSAGVNGLVNRIGRASAAIGNFNTIARVGTSSARAIGTSMIFAGGAFRDLGVGINVAASLFQTFIPIISAFTTALGPAGLLLAPLAGNLIAMGAALGAVGAGLFEITKRGIAFNAALEKNVVTVGTLIAEFKTLTDEQGNAVGAIKDFNAAAFEQLSLAEQQTEIDNRRNAATLRIVAGQQIAKEAVVQLTVAAADSIYTTQQLMGAFQATYSVLGRYGATAKQAAGLTVELARVASVAGVSAANLASQLTLFLTGAGRITSPLTRFAASLGLTKEYMANLRKEFRDATNDVDATQKIFNKLTNILSVFSVGGRLMSDTWEGIMSNMGESLDLFAGAATTGIFEKIRNAIFSIETDANGAITRISGAMNKIFKIDPKTGTFFKTVEKQLDVFQEPIQRAIASLNTLFSIIGDDIAKAIDYIFTKVVEVADWVGKNEDKVLEVYYRFRDILESVGNIVVILLDMVGVSGDLDSTVENIDTWLRAIRFTLNLIALALASIQTLVGLFVIGVGLLVAGFGRLVYLGGYILATLHEWGVAFQNFNASVLNLIGNVINFISRLLGFGEIVIPIRFAVFDKEKSQQTLDSLWGDATKPGSDLIDFGTGITDSGVNNFRGVTDLNRRQANANTLRASERKERADQIRTQMRTLTSADGQRLFTDADLSRMSDNDLIRLQQDEASRRKKDKRYKETPKPFTGDDTGTGAGRGAKGRNNLDDRLKSLFADRQKLAEAGLDLIVANENNAYRAIQENLKRQEAIIKSQLDTFAITYSEYYRKLDTIRQTDLAAEKQHVQNLINIENQRFQFALDALEEERRDAEENFKRTGNNAKYQRELQSIQIKQDVERLKYRKEIANIRANEAQIDAEDLETRRKNAVEEAEIIRKLRSDLREFQSDFDSTTGDLSSEALNRANEKVTYSLALQVRELQRGLGVNKEIDAEINKQIDNLGTLLELQTSLNAVKFAQAQLDREQASHVERVTDLEGDRNRGLISNSEYSRRLIAENRAYAVELRKLVDAIAEQANSLPKNSAARAEQLVKIAQLKREIIELETATESVLFGAISEARGGLTTFFEDIQKDVTDIGGAFVRLGQTIVGTFQKVLAEAVVREFMGAFLGPDGQTEGRAGGFFARILRGLGVDPNSKASEGNNRPIKPTGTSVSVGEDTAVATSRQILEQTVQKIDAEAGKFGTAADNLTFASKTLNEAGTKLGVYADKLQQIQVERAADGAGKTSITSSTPPISESEDGLVQIQMPDGTTRWVKPGTTQVSPVYGTRRNGKRKTSILEGVELVGAPTGGTSGMGPGGTPFFNPNAGSGLGQPEVVTEAPTTDTLIKENISVQRETLNPISTFIDAKLSDILKAIRETKKASEETTEAIDDTADAVSDVSSTAQASGSSLIGSLKQLGNWLGDVFSMIGGFVSQLFGGGGGGTVDVIFNGITGIAKASGGYIRGGGTTTSDSIPAMLSDKEYVVKAESVKKLGIPFMDFLNKHGKIPAFAGGTQTGISSILKKMGISGGSDGSSPTFPGAMPSLGGSSGGGFWSSGVGAAIQSGGITAAISIGTALLGRWLANRAYKKQLEEYKKNRTKDPYGLNPETNTFYHKPIISGSRNWLALGGLVQAFAGGGLASSKGMLNNLSFAGGGMANLDSMNGLLSSLDGGNFDSSPVNIRQNVNIQTPDIHSFRNSRAAIERDMSRMAQRGARRRSPKY